MQSFFIERNGIEATRNPQNIQKVKAVMEAQIAAIERAKAAKIPIVLVEYESETKEKYGNTLDEITSAVSGYRNTRIIKKTTQSVFDKKNKHVGQFKQFLKSENIGKLLIMGANGGYCIKDSIQDALEHNCSVIAYNQGIADFDSSSFIYPYSGRLSKVRKNCTDCEFKEVSRLETFENHMINNDRKNEASKPKTKSPGAR